jgi:hypothetical protein
VKHVARIVALLTLFCGCAEAQKNAAPPTTPELLRILRITNFRVRTPNHPDYVWDIRVLKREELKSRGTRPKGLTIQTGLLSMREKADGVYEFMLPERSGAYSQGDFELCKETHCADQYSLRWLKRPVYSADGTQCLLGELSNLGDERPSAYIALVRVYNKPS